MKKVVLCIVLALCVPAWAVNLLTENFDGPAMVSPGFTVVTPGVFDGAGHYVMTETDYIYRHVNTGDFNMQLTCNAIDMGNPTAGYNIWNYLINHKGDNSEKLIIFFYKSGTALQFAVDKSIGGVGTREFTEDLTSLTSAVLQVVWNETAQTYTVSLGVNGGAVVQKVVVSGFTASDFNRHDYIYGSRTDTEAGKPVLTLDRYVMTAPFAGQVDSFDNIAGSGWAANPGTIAQETTTQKEGTGSMKLIGGSGNLEAYKYLSSPIDVTADTYFQFWCYGDGSGNQFQFFLIDTVGNVARYIDYITWTGWRPIVVKTSLIGKDTASPTFDYGNVHQIHFLVVGATRGDVYVDDLRVDSNPVTPMEVSYCEPASPFVYQIGVGPGVGGTAYPTFSYDTTEKTEGASSLAMNFTTAASYEQVCIYLTQYLNGGAPNVPKDLTKYTHVEFDLYGDGSGNRFEMRFAKPGGHSYYKWINITWIGWKHFKIARSSFSNSGAGDWSQVDSVRMFNPDGTAMNVKLDNLVVVYADPNQIDSFDDIASSGWSAQDNSFLFQDMTVKHEGLGSLRMDFTPSAPVDNWITANKAVDLSAADIALTFWTKTTLQGKERITNITIWDGSSPNRSARYSFENVPTTTDWYKVTCPLVGFAPDGAALDLSHIVAIQIKFTTHDVKPAVLGSVWLDDLRIEAVTVLPDPTYYYAEKVAAGAIVLDGAVSDWANLKSWTQHQEMEGPAGDLDREHDIRYAWDASNLYMLIQETVVDNDPWAAADEFDWAAAPYKYDTVGLFDFPNKAVYDSFWIGMTSDGLARFEKRIAGGSFVDVTTVAHAVVGGKRITELSIPLTEILGAVEAAMVIPGYSFRCNPLIVDGYIGFNWERTIQSFPGGASWSADSTGENVTYITFVCSPADIDGNCQVDFTDFGIFATQWLREDCKVNDGLLCLGADIAPQTGDGTVDILDIREFAAYWLEQN